MKREMGTTVNLAVALRLAVNHCCRGGLAQHAELSLAQKLILD